MSNKTDNYFRSPGSFPNGSPGLVRRVRSALDATIDDEDDDQLDDHDDDNGMLYGSPSNPRRRISFPSPNISHTPAAISPATSPINGNYLNNQHRKHCHFVPNSASMAILLCFWWFFLTTYSRSDVTQLWTMNHSQFMEDFILHHPVANPERLFPRVVRLEHDMPFSWRMFNATRPLRHPRFVKRRIRYPLTQDEFFVFLNRSNDFQYYYYTDPVVTEDCEPQYAWQLASRPVCNKLHELDMAHLTKRERGNNDDKASWTTRARIIAGGYWADVWVWVNDNDPDERFVLKTMRWHHDVTGRNIDRYRRDSMAMERLTKSKYVVNQFGYCNVAGMVEYSDGGDLDQWIVSEKSKATSLKKLRIGMNNECTHNANEVSLPGLRLVS